MNHEAEPIQLSDGLARSGIVSNKVDKGAEATGIYKCAFMLSEEVSLDLIEDASKCTVGVRKHAELPGGISAPEENSLRNVLLSNVVDSNGHEIVVLNA